jgi:hypothetical protein
MVPNNPFERRLRQATAYALELMRAGKSPAAANAQAGRYHDVCVKDVAQKTGRHAAGCRKKKQARVPSRQGTLDWG